MRSFYSGLGVLVAGTLLQAALPACRTTCDDYDDKPRTFTDGLTNLNRTEYQTSTWDGPFLEFGPGRVYELKHGLKGRPTSIRSYVAFNSTPLPGGGSGSVSESAGSQTDIKAVTDEIIRIQNNTCAEFFLRVVASLPDEGSPDANTGPMLSE